jgi:hypothetical protein
MTALPTIAYLRRHALPAHALTSLQGGRPADISPTRSARPALVATWHIGADNCLVCHWSVDRAFSVPSGLVPSGSVPSG